MEKSPRDKVRRKGCIDFFHCSVKQSGMVQLVVVFLFMTLTRTSHFSLSTMFQELIGLRTKEARKHLVCISLPHVAVQLAVDSLWSFLAMCI